MYWQLAHHVQVMDDCTGDFWNQHPQLHKTRLFWHSPRAWNSEYPVRTCKKKYMYMYLRLAHHGLENDDDTYDFWNQRPRLHKNRLSVHLPHAWRSNSAFVSRKSQTNMYMYLQLAHHWLQNDDDRYNFWNQRPQLHKVWLLACLSTACLTPGGRSNLP